MIKFDNNVKSVEDLTVKQEDRMDHTVAKEELSKMNLKICI